MSKREVRTHSDTRTLLTTASLQNCQPNSKFEWKDMSNFLIVPSVAPSTDYDFGLVNVHYSVLLTLKSKGVILKSIKVPITIGDL